MIPSYLINYILSTRFVVRQHTQVKQGAVYVLASIEQSSYYIEQAILNGARYIIVNDNIQLSYNAQYLQYKCEIIYVKNTQKVWAFIANLLYYKTPNMISAITGTSGKTSIAYLYTQAIAMLNFTSLYVGTLGIIDMNNNKKIAAINNTTPDIMELRKILMHKQYDYMCIEASSHGILQHRIDYLPIKIAAFTNLTQDHLDYHDNMNNYFNSKKRLFTNYNIKNFVLNSDDQYSQLLIENCKKYNVLTYGINGNIKLINYQSYKDLTFNYLNQAYNIKFNFLGVHNAYNILCVLGMLIQSGFQIKNIISVLSQISLPSGRMQKIQNNQTDIFIDYAHKPHALELVLQSLIEYKILYNKKEIWTILGCGGNRDSSKRNIMGQIVNNLSDQIIITDDNPRHEDASTIRKQIISGITKHYFEIANREQAIKYALKSASNNSIILIAGKGHENYQVIGNKKLYFSDYEVVIDHIKD